MHEFEKPTTRTAQRRTWLSPSLVLSGIGILVLLVPILFSAPAANGRERSPVPERPRVGRGGSLLPPLCGTPMQIVAQVGGQPSQSIPASALAGLPHPMTAPTTLAATEATYTPTTNQLCIGSSLALQSLLVGTAPLTTGRLPTPTATAPTTQPPTSADPQAVGPSRSWVQATLSTLVRTYQEGFGEFVLSKILGWASSFGFMLITPEDLTYQHPVVLRLNAWVAGFLDGLVTLILVIAGYQLLFFGRTELLRELLPRLVLCSILANFSLVFLKPFIDALDVLCVTVEAMFAASGIRIFVPAGPVEWTGAMEYLLLLYLVDLIVLVLLSLQMLARIALLDLLLVIAPIGFLCFVLPQTQVWARLWAQTLISTLIVQFLQVLCAGLGSALIASLLGGTSFTPISLLAGIATLVLTFKLPDLLLTHSGRVMQHTAAETGIVLQRLIKTVQPVLRLLKN